MKLALTFRLTALLFVCAAALGQAPGSSDGGDRQEWEQLRKSFEDPRSVNLFQSGTWTLTHAADSKKEVDEVLQLVLVLGKSFEKKDPALLNGVGGVRGFKDKAAGFLKSSDDVVAGFAATLLAISGDKRYAPSIATLLETKEPPEDDENYHRPVSSRGRAAVALSLLGAREYVPRFVQMLRSRNRYDRAGAASALGQLGAKEHAKEVAALLSAEDFMYEDDQSPVYALAEMGVVAEYADELAKVLGDELRGETVEAAAYALASVGARQYAKDVAKLLDQKFRKGDAAKALAIMGADEYKGRIASLLDDKDSLVRDDALLALGVLNAREYAPRIAGFLNDPSSASNRAATALVLMGELRYAQRCVPLVERAYRANLYLGADEFHPLVERQLVKHRARFAESFLKMKALLSKSR